MKVHVIFLKRVDNDYHMEATNDTGNVVSIDGNPSIGGHKPGRPTYASCCSWEWEDAQPFDIISTLGEKQKIEPTSIDVEIEGRT